MKKLLVLLLALALLAGVFVACESGEGNSTTAQNEDSSNFGALSITCEAEDGTEITLRTIVLKDESGKTITASAFPIGSKINARGVVDVYNGTYQLKVFSANDITFVN